MRYYILTHKIKTIFNEFLFKEGLYIDPNGIEFLDEIQLMRCLRWTGDDDLLICKVKIPSDAQITYTTRDNRTDKIILGKLIKFSGNYASYINWNKKKICKLAVQYDGLALKYVKRQTPDICKLAVLQNGLALKYVKDQTERICILAVRNNVYALEYVKYQTEKICKLAVQRNGLVLKYVIDQTEEICKLAVQDDGDALQYVKKQTEEICKLAVEENHQVLYYYVKNMTKDILDSVIGDIKYTRIDMNTSYSPTISAKKDYEIVFIKTVNFSSHEYYGHEGLVIACFRHINTGMKIVAFYEYSEVMYITPETFCAEQYPRKVYKFENILKMCSSHKIPYKFNKNFDIYQENWELLSRKLGIFLLNENE